VKPLLTILIITLLFTTGGTSQPLFEKIYGGKGDQYGFGVAVTNGGYAVCGHTALPGSMITDAWVLYLDQNGDTLWTRKYGGTGIDEARSVIVTPDSALLVCGTYSHSAPSKIDFYLLKITLDGDTLWTRNRFTPLNAYGYSVAPAPNGYILCGYADVDKSTPRMILVRTDENGDTLWTRLYGDSLTTTGFSAIGTVNGGFIACGYIDHYDPVWNRNTYVVRTNGNGDTLWTRTYLNSGYDVAWSISEAQGNGFIMTGYRDFPGSSGMDLYITRLDGNGNVMWEKNYGQTGLDIGYSGIETLDGGFVFCGQSNEEGNEFQSLYMVRTDAAGDSLWTRMLGEYPKNSGSCIRQASDGGFIIAGATNSVASDGLYDVLVIRTDEDGIITSSDPAPGDPAGVSVWPNPCNGTFRIHSASPVLLTEILDMTGRTVDLKETGSQSRTDLFITLPAACKGPFLLRFTTLQGKYTGKLIVF
jgi:hypothetical protein